MLTPTARMTCVTMTLAIAVGPSWSQFGPSRPTSESRPLIAPLSWRRKPQTRVQATTEMTTGEKKSVRNRAPPGILRLSKDGQAQPEGEVQDDHSPEKTAVVPSTAPMLGSLIARS